MNSLIMLLIIVPALAFLLLLLNVVLAVHKPDESKVSAYECGFISIFGQTRSNFQIHFFLVALLFLVFDLEIILIMPVGVTLYDIGNFGFSIFVIFFIILTIGFVLEIGSGAIKFTTDNNNLTNPNQSNNNGNIMSTNLNKTPSFPYPSPAPLGDKRGQKRGENIITKSFNFIYHYKFSTGWLGIIGSFTIVFLFFKFGIKILPFNIGGLIVWTVISFALACYYYDRFKLSNNGFVKGIQIICLTVIAAIFIVGVSSEFGILDIIYCDSNPATAPFKAEDKEDNGTSNSITPNSSNTTPLYSNSEIDSYVNDLFNGLVETFGHILKPVSVNYSNEILSNQLYSISILLFILSIVILIILIAFLVNIISFMYSEKLLNYFTNKYIVKYITYNREIIKIEIIFVGFILIYFVYQLAFGLHYLATHPIVFN